MCYDGNRQLPLFIDPGEERHGYVYLLIAHNHAAFKVGYTSRAPRRRGGELKQDGQMLCWWPGDHHDEQRLHGDLEVRRLLGHQEWYTIAPDTLAFLLEQCQRYDFPQSVRLLQDIARQYYPDLTAA